MTNLRACVVPVSLAAVVLAVVPAFAANTIDSVTVGIGQRINSDSAKVVAGNSDYLIMDLNGPRYLWDVKNGVYVSAPAGNNYTSISGNVVAGDIGTSANTWTISGGSAAPTEVVDGTKVAVYGNAGGLVVGVKDYTYVPFPEVPDFVLNDVHNAVYNTGGNSGVTYILPRNGNEYYNSTANAVTQRADTSTYTVGGWQSNDSIMKTATIWNLNTSTQLVTSVTLHDASLSEVTAVSGNLQGGYTTAAGNHTATIWRGDASTELALADGSTTISDIDAVAEAVNTVGGKFDIAVGSIDIGQGDHAALWLIDDNTFRLIQLADPASQSLMYSYATGIGLDADGNLAAIYGFGTPDGGEGQVALAWSVDGLSTTPVPEPLAAGMLTVGFGALLLRRPRRTH